MLRQHHDSIRTRLHDYVAIAVKTIDPEQLALLKTLNDEGSETYKQIVEGLRSIHDSISDIKFVYTAKLNHEGKIIIIADVEESEKDKFHLGDVFDDAAGGLLDAAQSSDGPKVE